MTHPTKQITTTKKERKIFNPCTPKKISQGKYDKLWKQSFDGYLHYRNMVFFLFEKESEDEIEYYMRFICSKFVITDSYYLEGNEGYSLLMDIRIYGNKGEFNDVLGISFDAISQKGIDKLQNRGLLYNPQRVYEVISLITGQLMMLEKKKVLRYPGWRKRPDETFSFVGYDSTTYRGFTKLSISDIKTEENTLRKISAEEHINKINPLIDNVVSLQMFVSMSLSSALIGYLNVADVAQLNTPIAHIYGNSSTGKTTALILAASIWGKPKSDTGLLNSWNATPAKIQTNLSNNNGVLFTLNEFGSVMNKNDLTELVYNIAEGTGRDRMYNKNPSIDTWNTFVLSCGEASLFDVLDSKKGLYARVLEFPNIDITLSAKHADEIKETANSTYGAIGFAFVNFVTDNQEYIVSKYREHSCRIRNRISTFSSISSRVANIFAVIYLAAEIARDILELKINCQDIETMLLEYHKKTLIEYPSWVVNHGKIMSYVSVNRSLFQDYRNHYSAEGYVEGDMIIFIDLAFDKICQKLDIDKSLFLAELKDNGVLDCPPDRFYKKKTISGVTNKVYCIYKDLNTLKTQKSGCLPLSTSSGKKPAQPAVNELNLIEKEELMSYEFYS